MTKPTPTHQFVQGSGFPDGEGCAFVVEGHGWTITDPICCRKSRKEHEAMSAQTPSKHKYWQPGERDCPSDIKAPNGELHTLRCKICGQDSPLNDDCSASITEELDAAIAAGDGTLHGAIDCWKTRADNAEEALQSARLFIAEIGDKLLDPMYSDATNREGLAEDCKQFATGEVCAKYLEVKWQAERALRAEERVCELEGFTDLMRDEFQRIIVCCSSTDTFVAREIVGLCRRAIHSIEQNVSVVLQRDRALSLLAFAGGSIQEIAEELRELRELREDCKDKGRPITSALIDTAVTRLAALEAELVRGRSPAPLDSVIVYTDLREQAQVLLESIWAVVPSEHIDTLDELFQMTCKRATFKTLIEKAVRLETILGDKHSQHCKCPYCNESRRIAP
jgi:hypothetical protein